MNEGLGLLQNRLRFAIAHDGLIVVVGHLASLECHAERPQVGCLESRRPDEVLGERRNHCPVLTEFEAQR